MKMKKNKIIASVLATLMLSTAMITPSTPLIESTSEQIAIVQTMEASAAQVRVIKGCFNDNNWSGSTYVRVLNTNKNAKIKVCAFREDGKIKNGKFKVEITTPSDSTFSKVISCSGYKYITLNYGYSSYNVRIIRNGKGNTNVSRTRYWSIDYTKNCNPW